MTQHNTHDGSRIRRRGFVKLGIGAGATAAGIAAGSSPAAAQSCDPEQSLSCSYGGQPDYGVSYLIGTVKEHFGGLGSTEEYSDKQSDQFYIQTRKDAELIKAANDSVLTTVQNLLENAKSVAYQIGRGKLLEELNAGTGIASAQTAAEGAITAYFLPNQKNLIERFNVMVAQIKTALDRAAELSSPPGTWAYINTGQDWSSTDVGIKQDSYTLVDGTDMSYQWLDHLNNANESNLNTNYRPTQTDYGIVANSSAGYDSRLVVTDMGRWRSILPEIQNKHDAAISEIRTFVDGIQDQYQAGEISTEDIVTPNDLWSMSSDDAETPYAAADLAGLGLEVNQDSAVVVDLLTDGIKREGSVYLSKSPIGGSLAVGNVYDPSLSRSTDADGNYTDSQSDYAGTESDPYPIDGLAFLAYNTDNGSTYDQIKQPFKVESVFGEDGEELQSAGFAPSTGQQTTTTDIDELRSELQSLNDEIIELEKERAELATSGGTTGGSSGGIIAAAAGVGGVLALLLGGRN